MSKSRLEFKIVKDSDGKDIELDNLSILSAKALNVFLESIIKLVEAMPDHEGIRFKIIKGSAGVVAEGPETKMSVAELDFNKVVERSSTKTDVIHSWRDVQKLILNNSTLQSGGLQFEVNYYTDTNQKKQLLGKLTEKKFIRLQPKRREPETKITFIKANLTRNGGEKNPNFHLMVNGQEIVIHCDKETALRVSPFLYKPILISAWRKNNGDAKPSFTFCDVYIHEHDLENFKALIDKNYSLSESEEFINIHDKLKECFDKKEFSTIKKIMRLYNHPSTHNGTLKTILVVTKSFKDHDEIKEIRSSIKAILEKKIGKKLV